MTVPKIYNNQSEINHWGIRRQEIFRLFEDYEYGKIPDIKFDDVRLFHNGHLEIKDGYILDTFGLVFFKDKKYYGLQYEMFYKEGLKNASPSILQINPFSISPIGYMLQINQKNMSEIFPVKMIADSGFIAVNCCVDKICPDDENTYKYGIMQIEPAKGPAGWSAISVWAWATSRIIDQLVENPLFDSSRITVYGCSRAGKTALWCGASDLRIKAVYAAVSGCCGAAMHRGKTGETIEKITSAFPHWSCEKFKEFINKEEELPMDQHMLLSLIAPRPLYISSASLDSWSHPEKEFESCVRVSVLYEAMGKAGLSSKQFPVPDSPIKGGDIQYHLRAGEHGCRIYDWEQVIPFLKRELSIN